MKAKKKIEKAVKQARSTSRFSILRMPEDTDEAPHWLFWLLVIALIALLASWIWESVSLNSSLQAYLPYL
ncbi:MAG: hypothetical protein PHR51_01570 [Patescibacteria group bacterium]|nr:hypothetical protein [Patescibacteria group bacterium]